MHYILILGLFLVGCTEALPKKNPQGEVSKSLETAVNTEDQINKIALNVRKDRERAEVIFQEAKKLLLEAEKAQKECEAALLKIEKTKKSIPKAKPCIEPVKEVVAPVVKPEIKSNDPEYSPSDAPIGWKK